jgi:hypothetical protein
MSAALIAGLVSGTAGLLVFLVIHHFWIQPIWFILPMGLLIAGGGGLAVGWAYQELMAQLPSRPWSALALIALISAILAPAIVLAELRAPLFSGTTAETAVLRVSVGRAAMVFVLELLATSAIAGALAGWWIGGTGRAAMATALAGSVFALGPGHNIPFLGNTPGTAKGIIVLLAVVAVSAFVLVEVEMRLRGGPLPVES